MSKLLAERLQDAVDIALDQGDEDLLTVNVGRQFIDCTLMLNAFESYCIRQVSKEPLLFSNMQPARHRNTTGCIPSVIFFSYLNLDLIAGCGIGVVGKSGERERAAEDLLARLADGERGAAPHEPQLVPDGAGAARNQVPTAAQPAAQNHATAPRGSRAAQTGAAENRGTPRAHECGQ